MNITKVGVKMSKWDAFQKENGKWSDETFGVSWPEAALEHLKKEIEELLETPYSPFEYADCMILLLDAARKIGLRAETLLLLCKIKLEINKRRKWGPPDKNGVVEHISEKKEIAWNTKSMKSKIGVLYGSRKGDKN